ncbi:MAG: zinc-binding dehydrogenase [Rhodospirillaceae bacterium]|nr:zinc-binding dehydrogenase [Rhodospirillaceae bacterium]
MRAIVIDRTGPADLLKVSDIPTPEPGAGQVRIRVAYAAVHPLDIHARSGAMKWGVPPLPFTLGYSYCGRIDKVGPGVDAGLIGKRVTVSSQYGGYADHAVTAAANVVPIADALDWQVGGFAMGSTLTAWHMLHTLARVRPAEWIVVHSAAGPVGAMLTQIAKAAGCRVIGLVGGPAKVAWAKQFGADHLIDYVADRDWPTTVKTLTQGPDRPNGGVDFIMDGNLGPDAAKQFACLAPLGQVIAIGAMAGPAPEVNISKLIAGSHGVRGFVVGHGMAKTNGAERPELVAKIASGAWRFPVSVAGPLEQAAAAHRAFESRATVGRTLLAVGGEI